MSRVARIISELLDDPAPAGGGADEFDAREWLTNPAKPQRPWGYMLRSRTPKSPYPWFAKGHSDRYGCCGNFRRAIGDGTVFKRLSTAKQWPEMEVVPIYGNPRVYGEKVLDWDDLMRYRNKLGIKRDNDIAQDRPLPKPKAWGEPAADMSPSGMPFGMFTTEAFDPRAYVQSSAFVVADCSNPNRLLYWDGMEWTPTLNNHVYMSAEVAEDTVDWFTDSGYQVKSLPVELPAGAKVVEAFDPRAYMLADDPDEQLRAEMRRLGFRQTQRRTDESDETVRDYFLAQPAMACKQCGADMGSPMALVRNYTFKDGLTAVAKGHAGPGMKWELDQQVPQPFQFRKDIVDIDTFCSQCHGRLNESDEQPELTLGSEDEGFDPRQYFIDSSSVSFRQGDQRVTWNFGGEPRKDIELYGGAVTFRMAYHPDEWKPSWTVEARGNIPWKGKLDAPIAGSNCGSERLLPKRIETVLKKAEKWYEKHRWGMAIYPLIYGPNGVKDYVGELPDWADYVEQHAGDLPTEFENQTEESAAAWKDLIFKFRAERGYGVQESEELFDPRAYILQDVGPAIVDRLKVLGYKQIQLRILTDRHATLTMNDPNPEYEDEEDGGGIDQTKRVYTRNRVKTIVRELMGLPTEVYDFSGDCGTDYLFKICDPEHCGIQGTYEAEDSFDPRDYVLTTPTDYHTWRVAWEGANDGVSYRSKGFPTPEKAMRYIYTSSLWNKASRVCVQRINQHTLDNYSSPAWTDDDFKEFEVTRDYELIDPDTGRVLIREALVYDSEFDARNYMEQPDSNPEADFDDLLDRIGFDLQGQHTRVLRQGDEKFVVQLRSDGKYRYAIYDRDGRKVRGQIVLRQQLIDMLQQHLNMKLRESEDFDAREWMLRDPDQQVMDYMAAQGFKEYAYPGGQRPKFYAVWTKQIGPFEIASYRGVKDEKLGSSRWWLEIWEHGRNKSPGIGNYHSAHEFLPRLQRQVDLHTDLVDRNIAV